MKVEYKTESAGGVLSLSGELDHHAATTAIKEINAILDIHHPGELELDMRNVSFMDSSGLALLLNTHRRQRQIGGNLKLTNVPFQAMRVLSSAGMDKVVRID